MFFPWRNQLWNCISACAFSAVDVGFRQSGLEPFHADSRRLFWRTTTSPVCLKTQSETKSVVLQCTKLPGPIDHAATDWGPIIFVIWFSDNVLTVAMADSIFGQ